MFFKEFLETAKRFSHTCSIINKKIGDLGIREIRTAESRYLFHNLYYLSGYVIECSFKYGIYALYRYPPTKDVKELDLRDLSYKNNIQHHRFNVYEDYLLAKLPGSLRDLKKKSFALGKTKELFNKWDGPVRYHFELGAFSSSDYLEFYKFANQVLTQIVENV